MRLGTTTFSFTNEWLTRRFTRGGAAGARGRVRARPRARGRRPAAVAWLSDPRPRRGRSASGDCATGSDSSPLRSADTSTSCAGPGRAMTARRGVDALEAADRCRRGRLGFPRDPAPRRRPGPGARAASCLAPSASDVVLATELQGGQTPDDPAVQAIARAARAPRRSSVRRPRPRLQRRDDAPSRRRSSTPSAVPAWRRDDIERDRALGGVVVRLSASSSARSRRPAPPTSRKTRRGRGSSASDGRIPPVWAPLVSRRRARARQVLGARRRRSTTRRRQPRAFSTCCSREASRASSPASGAAAHGSTPTTWTRSRSSRDTGGCSAVWFNRHRRSAPA